MVGGDGLDGIRQGLQSVLYDLQVRQRLLERAEAFAARYRMKPAPGAAGRAAEEIAALASRR
jgi:hypothetical protein